MNWETFLVNPFLTDCKEARDKGMEFHYASLLILIALVTWREPEEKNLLEGTQDPCLAKRYVSLWHITYKNRKMDNNVIFYIYKETIW
jgi:hypothetical protein